MFAGGKWAVACMRRGLTVEVRGHRWRWRSMAAFTPDQVFRSWNDNRLCWWTLTSCIWCAAPSAVHRVPLPIFTRHKRTVQWMTCLQTAFLKSRAVGRSSLKGKTKTSQIISKYPPPPKKICLWILQELYKYRIKNKRGHCSLHCICIEYFR